MRLVTLDASRLELFFDYCRKHRGSLDTSYITDQELSRFALGDGNPTCLGLGNDSQILAAASLILDEASQRSGRARLRLLHAESGTLAHYRALIDGLLKEAGKLLSIYLFAKHSNPQLMAILEALGFELERHVYMLLRQTPGRPAFSLGEGYEIRQYVKGQDEQAWCTVRNEAFSNLTGNEAPITPKIVAEMASGTDTIAEAMILLLHEGKPVGVARGAWDDYGSSSTMSIGPIAVFPTYQGRGLGRAMLRFLLCKASDMGFGKTTLSVNAKNDSALSLYLSEGFKKDMTFACYVLSTRNSK